MKKCQIDIKGMHCRSCEILIEEELSKVGGVSKAVVDHKKGIAEILYQGQLDNSAVAQAIEGCGYSIGKDGKPPLFSSNLKDYIDLGYAIFAAVAIYVLAKALGILDIGKSISGGYTSLTAVFLIGLTAGVSTCMALVGGLVLGAASRFSEKHPRATGFEKFKPHVFFNLGRIGSYFVLGGVIGYAGSVFQLSTSVLGILTVAVGMVMLLLGGQLIDIFPFLKKISFTLPKSISQALGIKDQAQAEYSHKNSAIMGGLTFFLPCGFTQAMQLYAMSTGSPLQGALTMGVFAIGTAPGLLSVGGLTSVIKGAWANMFFKVAGVVVIFLSIFNIQNGLNLIGFNSNILGAFTTLVATASDKSGAEDPNVKLVNGVQEVRMTQRSNGYSPNKFTIKKDIPVRWIITSTDGYSCASALVSQKLGVQKYLQEGENIIEFTPTQLGTIPFSCSMGMYTGSFLVVDKNAKVTQKATTTATNDQPSTGASCGSGGCGCGAKRPPTTQTGTTPKPAGKTEIVNGVQVIKTIYTDKEDIVPNTFTVKANQPVRLEITVNDDGYGCMGSFTIPRLTNQISVLTKGQNLIYEFTPTTTGTYPITCAMGVPRGQIFVN